MELYTYTEVVSHRCIAYTLIFSHVHVLSETRILYIFLYTHYIPTVYNPIYLYVYLYILHSYFMELCLTPDPPNHIQCLHGSISWE